MERGDSILIYGPAGTGKTHLAFHLYQYLLEVKASPVLVATEPGTTVYLRSVGWKDYLEARTLDEMATTLTRATASGMRPVVDSINWHYRENPGLESARILAYSMALIYTTGGVATAQVSLEGQPSGAPFIVPWARVVVRTGRRGGGIFEARMLRPERRLALFRVHRGVVEWL